MWCERRLILKFLSHEAEPDGMDENKQKQQLDRRTGFQPNLAAWRLDR